MFVIGLTGGIGSGKTMASNYLASLGITIVDADQVARDVVAVGEPALKAIVDHFGSAVCLPDGNLNRPALRAIVFADPTQRKILEHITHPAIRQCIQQQLSASTSAYSILVSPLLFESGQAALTHRTLLIDAPETLQQQRASARDGVSEAQIASIIAVQMPRHEKQKRADDIIVNHGNLDDLYHQLDELHQRYLVLSQQYV